MRKVLLLWKICLQIQLSDLVTRVVSSLAMLKRKAPFLKHMEVIIQHDGAKPHNGRGNLDKLNEYGQLDGWNIVIETQQT